VSTMETSTSFRRKLAVYIGDVIQQHRSSLDRRGAVDKSIRERLSSRGGRSGTRLLIFCIEQRIGGLCFVPKKHTTDLKQFRHTGSCLG